MEASLNKQRHQASTKVQEVNTLLYTQAGCRNARVRVDFDSARPHQRLQKETRSMCAL